jgi:hypothetical protein
MKAIALGLCGMTVLLVAGCGLRGDLARPAPLWGEERARYEAEQAAQTSTAPSTATSIATATSAPPR